VGRMKSRVENSRIDGGEEKRNQQSLPQGGNKGELIICNRRGEIGKEFWEKSSRVEKKWARGRGGKLLFRPCEGEKRRNNRRKNSNQRVRGKRGRGRISNHEKATIFQKKRNIRKQGEKVVINEERATPVPNQVGPGEGVLAAQEEREEKRF